MKKFLLIYSILILYALNVSAQSDVSMDELFKSDTMTTTFEKLGKKELIVVYGFDENSERLIRAHYYFNRLRFEVIPATFCFAFSAYGTSLFIPAIFSSKPDYEPLVIITSAILLTTTVYEGYLIYEGIQAQTFAGEKSNLYKRLRNYYLTKELTKEDEKIIKKHKNRRIPYILEVTKVIKR